MNADSTPRTPWYRVAEVWLIFVLLAATVVGTFVMMALASRQPDIHLVVPNDVPRPSKIPPITPASAATAPDAGAG